MNQDTKVNWRIHKSKMKNEDIDQSRKQFKFGCKKERFSQFMKYKI